MTKYLRISPYITKPFLIYDFATAPILICYEENFILFFISARYFRLVTAPSRQLISPDHRKKSLLVSIYAPRYEASLTFLLSTSDSGLASQVEKIINKKDLLGNTALHYATQKWSQASQQQFPLNVILFSIFQTSPF
jgi:hypothetical protein